MERERREIVRLAGNVTDNNETETNDMMKGNNENEEYGPSVQKMMGGKKSRGETSNQKIKY